ncbi:hypothetical protein LARV_01724 [Longilinea arvoryzae]|uniref:Transglutaminase-like domain-containing protein n=1 Tax=Longilinea arvoryzae TaxID=360412 RepID=A0A0S7BEK0_9CHLR|nr:hypothetical protein [Longilinea arvoryzae]GAP13965.1 hypothetical protein LARV_01724 [Longilinea arvoryzae]
MNLETQLTAGERDQLQSLNTPYRLQLYLDRLPYVAEERNRSPLAVLRDGQCHCYDGALLAAAVLRRMGQAPLVMNLWPEPGLDDDHVLALYRVDGCWGAVAKSNYSGLRFREPVYRSLRELAMTYFEVYYNLDRIKTLRSYTRPFDLSRMDALEWETDEGGVAAVEDHLHHLRRFELLTPKMIQSLSPVDERAYHAGMHGTNIEQSFGRRENP